MKAIKVKKIYTVNTDKLAEKFEQMLNEWHFDDRLSSGPVGLDIRDVYEHLGMKFKLFVHSLPKLCEALAEKGLIITYEPCSDSHLILVDRYRGNPVPSYIMS